MTSDISHTYAVLEKPLEKNDRASLKISSQDASMNMYDEVGRAENCKSQPQNGEIHNYEVITSESDYYNAVVDNTSSMTALHGSASDSVPGYSQLDVSHSPVTSPTQNFEVMKQAYSLQSHENTHLGKPDSIATSRKETQCSPYVYMIPCLFLLTIMVVAATVALVVAFILIADLQSNLALVMEASNNSSEFTSTTPVNLEFSQLNISELEYRLHSFFDQVEKKISGLNVSANSIKLGTLESQISNLTSFMKRIKVIQNETEKQISTFEGSVESLLVDHYQNVAYLVNMLQQNTSIYINNTKDILQRSISELTSSIVRDLQQLIEFKSCDEVNTLSLPFTSGEYYIRTSNGSIRSYCEKFSCNGIKGRWRRIAYLNTSDSSADQCPSGLETVTTIGLTTSRISCRRSIVERGCSSVFFSTANISYSRVCGIVNSYQIGSPDAFHDQINNSIEGNYVDGVSLTFGMTPRKHIWTFAFRASSIPNCHQDCVTSVPSFISSNYSCGSTLRCKSSDGCIAWDGEQCVGGSYFDRSLDQPTTDDIEMRVCRSSPRTNEDFRINLVELFVE